MGKDSYSVDCERRAVWAQQRILMLLDAALRDEPVQVRSKIGLPKSAHSRRGEKSSGSCDPA
ncbi:hypothetical protein LLG46_02665 [bacterium]|nr:hypothetical protein [bacterium]